MPPTLAEFVARWTGVQAAERANYQLYLTELSQALGVEPPRPAGSGYQFEFPIKVASRDGTESTNFVDLYKTSYFALEAKDEETGRSHHEHTTKRPHKELTGKTLSGVQGLPRGSEFGKRHEVPRILFGRR